MLRPVAAKMGAAAGSFETASSVTLTASADGLAAGQITISLNAASP